MEILLIIGAAIIGFTLVMIAVPPILRVARQKNLFEPIEERKIHTGSIPSLGGVAIFFGFVLSTIIATDGYTFDSLKYIIAAVILMFFIGLKDDLMIISAKKKFIVQLFAGVILITLGNVRLTNLHGVLGVYDIHYFVSLFLTLFIMIAIINAFNLIDGIDGLASGLAIVASAFLGVWFFLASEIQFSIMSFALMGSLAAFFLYNVFGHRNKLFMGDTGSLIIGLVVSTLVIKFNEFNIVKTNPVSIYSAPSVSFAVIIVPLIDTLRVMTIRLMQKRSPFSPDKNHIHHRILELVPNHLQVTSILAIATIFVTGIAILFNNMGLNVTVQFLLVFTLGILFSFVPSLLAKRKKTKLAHHPA
ncbi:MraY family glycosyltransferase [Maribellus maritimus]|uniref:MraY family glycosyltransferase n=1 Tax=Maribellus maritimus TaxID=2870838 RepID=UPI001EEB5D96|nr:MraY family glycosyltransferase [Maribellus maritimus]MCG6190401.1 undecaprenyl/decaprenyl-phosphate alpha-N-acetylglucosaminyl 1-phosphate transferase [Maribellus maritimus]